MPKVKLAKTTEQIRCIWGMARKQGLSDDQLHALALGETGKSSLKDLSFQEADKLIIALGGRPFGGRRTAQKRRREAGISTVATSEHLTLMVELASQRNWSAEALQKFCLRQTGKERPTTAADVNKVVEALKSMNRRDNLWDGK